MRYILAHIKQQTYSVTLRLNYNITPDISIQYYGSPFISTGIYDDFKKTLDAGADDINDRYHSFTESEISFDQATNSYHVNRWIRHLFLQ